MLVRIALREPSRSKAHPMSHRPRKLAAMMLGASVPLDAVVVLSPWIVLGGLWLMSD